MRALPPDSEVDVSGIGEVTFHPEWKALVTAVLDLGFRPFVVTNLARHYTDEDIELLAQFTELIVSLDTSDPDVTRRVRRSMSAERVLGNITRVKEAGRRLGLAPGPRVLASTGVYDPSVWSLPDTVRNLASAGVDGIQFWDLIEFAFTSGVRSVRRLDDHETTRAREAMAEAVRFLELAGIPWDIPGDLLCSDGAPLLDASAFRASLQQAAAAEFAAAAAEHTAPVPARRPAAGGAGVAPVIETLRSTFKTSVQRVGIAGVLAGVGMADWFRMRGPADPRLAEQVTIAVKTFERPAAIARFVRGARRVFGGRIVVADDSRVPWSSRDPLVDVIALPFASGVTVGRNAALDAVSTPYVLVADDDFVYTHATRWETALEYLERNPDVDAVAGIQIEVPKWYTKIFEGEVNLFPGHEPPLRPDGEVIDGLPVRVMTPQAYLARTDRLRQVRWNENLRMVDHCDFFSRASGQLVFVQDPGLPVFHGRTPWNKVYNHHRNDVAADQTWLAAHWQAGGTAPPDGGASAG